MIALDVVVGIGLLAWIGWVVYDQVFKGKQKKDSQDDLNAQPQE